jgi:hypothetical protein
LGEKNVFEGDTTMFAVGFGSQRRRGERQFFECVILKWRIAQLMDGNRPM